MRAAHRSRLIRAFAIVVFGVSSTVLAEHPAVPAGPDFQVNTYTTFNQYFPAIAVDADGDFVVVWDDESGQDGDLFGISAQRFHSDGTLNGEEFQVNTYSTLDQRLASVGLDAFGNFVVVWDDFGGRDGSGRGIFGQRFDSGGSAVGSEFQVNVYTTGDQVIPRIAVKYDGAFVVTWTDLNGDQEVRARLSPSNVLAFGREIPVNSYTTGIQRIPAIDMMANGDFVIAWYGSSAGDDFGIAAQRFSSAGTKVGDELQVNAYAPGIQVLPSVAVDDDGEFVVAWQDNSSRDGSDAGVFARRFDSNGDALGGDVQINSYTTGIQDYPVVAIDADGDHVIVWDDESQDGSYEGIFAQLYDSNGYANGGEFQVNTATTNLQCLPVVGMDADGDFVVVWSDEGTPGPEDVVGQRFADANLFADGFESGDTSAWSWRAP